MIKLKIVVIIIFLIKKMKIILFNLEKIKKINSLQNVYVKNVKIISLKMKNQIKLIMDVILILMI
jgi:hypothetical protein